MIGRVRQDKWLISGMVAELPKSGGEISSSLSAFFFLFDFFSFFGRISPMKRATFLTIFLLLYFYTPTIFAQVRDIQQFQKYNPDGKKYEFVKNYLVSLTYLKKNAERSQNPPEFSREEFEKGEFFKAFMDDLLRDNVDLRIARNFLKKYRTSGNGLILKTTDLFTQVCDGQIEINNRERAYVEKVYQAQINGGLESVNKKRFMQNLVGLSMERRESLKKLLEASMLINKILVSNKADDYGEFITLGVTEGQRESLLQRLDEFYEDGFQGELRQGQTFLQGSVAVIREVLGDDSWDTLE